MSDPTPLQTGQIRFFDNGIPVLEAGTYSININHQVTEPGFQVDSVYPATQYFMVQAPRFSLPAGTIVSCYPAQGNEGDFHECMPFMVFNDKHLPWNRALSGTTGTGFQAPWLALMVFTAADLQGSYSAPPAPQQPDPTYTTLRAITDIVGVNAANILGPQISLAANEQSLQAASVDVPGSIFQALAPALNELPFLAHLRQINTGGQTMDGMTGDGYYSVLLANRLSDPATKTTYIVHLVSLEGWENYLPGGSASFTSAQVARLVSLNSWTFTSDPAGGDFETLVNALDIDTLQLPFTPPLAWGADPNSYTAAQKEAQNRYANGYIALNSTNRLGENTFAWYRGPFTPQVPAMIANNVPSFTSAPGPLNSPDQALIYDPVNGVFDQSYAVAWETGRMLTLANRPAALAIGQWKKDGIILLQLLNNLVQAQTGQAAGALAMRMPAGAAPAGIAPDWEQVRKDVADPQAGNTKFMNYLHSNLGKHFVAAAANPGNAVVQLRNPSGLDQHLDKMPGLLTPQELQQQLDAGKDPHVYISEKLNGPAK